MEFECKGRKFDVCAVAIGDKWACAIYPVDEERKATARGLMICEPHAVEPHGRWVRFDSEAQAIDYGKNYIAQEFLRE